MYCHKCGKKIEEDSSVFCPNCGAQIKGGAVNDLEREKKNSLDLKKAMYIICGICGLTAVSIYSYANATTLKGHNDNFISQTFGSYWFEHNGIYIVGALLIICVVTGVIGLCTKSNKH